MTLTTLSTTPTGIPSPRHAARRALTTSIALTAAGLLLAPATAFAADGPSGPGVPHGPGPKPAGPVQTDGPGDTKPSGPGRTDGPGKSGPHRPGQPGKPGSGKPNGPSQTGKAHAPGQTGKPHGQPPVPTGPVGTVTKVATPKTATVAHGVTLSARVSPAHRGGPRTPAETGTVVFTVDGTPSTPIPVTKNKASERVKLAAGKHTVTAKYSGDGAHAASESSPLSIAVS